MKKCKGCSGQGCEGCYYTGEWNPTGQYMKESDYEMTAEQKEHAKEAAR